MCNPALVGIGVGAAGLGLSTISSTQKVQASNQAATYNASISRMNAQAAEAQATDALARGRRRETEQRLQTSRLEGSQRAAAGASGVSVRSGSVQDILSDTEFFGERDALDIRGNAAREAFGFRNQASNFNAQASLQESRVGSPLLAGAGTLLGGVSPLLNQFSSHRRNFPRG